MAAGPRPRAESSPRAVRFPPSGVEVWVAAAVYLFLHIFLLQWPERRARNEVARGAVIAAAIAIGASGAISYIFQEVFLVRLP